MKKINTISADDEETLCELYAAALELEGHQMTLCQNGAEALDR